VTRALVIRLTSLGDVVLTIPALRALHAGTGARVDLLTDPLYVPLLSRLPDLDAVHAFDASPLALARRLRPNRYDLVVDLQNKLRSAAVAHALGAPRVVRHVKRGPAALLAAALGRPSLARTGPAALHLQAPLTRLGLTPDRAPPRLPPPPPPAAWATAARPRIGLQVGGRHRIKSLPADRVAAVAATLPGHLTLIAGPGPADAADVAAVRARLAGRPLLDTTALDVVALAGALASLDAALCFDSGPMHLAAAVGTPVVALFGPTDPARWAPSAAHVLRHPVPCSPCTDHAGARCPRGHHRCLLDLDIVQITAALRATLPHA
jgi:ADP-heptose:LPS heptosyltransferase